MELSEYGALIYSLSKRQVHRFLVRMYSNSPWYLYKQRTGLYIAKAFLNIVHRSISHCIYTNLGTPISYPSKTSVGVPSQPLFPPVDIIYRQSALK